MKWNGMEWNGSVVERIKIYIVNVSRRILQNELYTNHIDCSIRGHYFMRIVFIYAELPE